jgi:serine O-acetyltransferase
MGLLADARSIQKKDPAARSLAEVMLLYPGFHALVFYKVSHWLYKRNRLFCARMVSQWGRGFTGIEIHPGATIGDGLFIDHGAGVVIGETAEIGNNVTLYHGVTLGGTGKDVGKRHPTVCDNVLIGTGCKVLGPITIGENSRIGANSVVLSCIPPNATAIGIPASVVRLNGSKVVHPSEELNQRDYPDVVHQQLQTLEKRLAALEAQLADAASDDTAQDA